MDEFELEVKRLRDDGAEATSLGEKHTDATTPPTPPTPPTSTASDSADEPRRRGRRIGAVVAILAVVLTGVLIIVISPGSRDELGALMFGAPTPTVPLPLGADVVYFEHAVPWAQSNPTIDGKPILLDLTGDILRFVLVERGRYTLAYNAPSLKPLRCSFSVPAAKGDTCPLGEHRDLNLAETVKLAHVIDVGGIPLNLPADQIAALEAAVRATIDVPERPTTVQVGERYLTDAGVQVATEPPSHRATEPPSATLIFHSERYPAAGCDLVERCGGACAYLCVPAVGGQSPEWSLIWQHDLGLALYA